MHVAISDLSVAEMSKIFGSQESAVRRLKEQASKFSKKSLKKAVDTLSDADYKIKSGQIDADEGMWLTLFSIMAEA